jgi:pyruvate formate lyase activating enzyme
MIHCKGYIDSVYSGSAVDGDGLRCVVFLSGCNLHCGFCHNPETLYKKGKEATPQELLEHILRYKAYIKKGGVTLSGGEPFLQKDFVIALCRLLRENNINVCIETNGHITDREIMTEADSFIVDVKNQDGCDLCRYSEFLRVAAELSKPVKLTNVIVPDVNDNADRLSEVKAVAEHIPAEHFKGIRFLPFRKLCENKYEQMGLAFPYAIYREGEKDDIVRVTEIYSKL